MKRNILLTIAYDGTDFHGWQRQQSQKTVQGHLESVLGSLMGREISLKGTSRTDAGVHAYGQRASFTADVGIPVEKLALAANNALAAREKGSFAISPVRIIKAEEKPLDFHARFDSKGKKYIYKIRNGDDIDIFERNYVYHVAKPLDIELMRRAAEEIVGTHDFKAFEASGSTERESTVRTVYSLEIEKTGHDIAIHVKGDGFLYNMVRIITGTLVDVGLEKIPLSSIGDIVRSRDRSKTGHTAPPYGLYLAEVYY